MTVSHNYPQPLVGRRVRVWQPLPLTSRAVYHGTLDHVTSDGRLRLVDVEVERGGERTPLHGGKTTINYSLNWDIEEDES